MSDGSVSKLKLPKFLMSNSQTLTLIIWKVHYEDMGLSDRTENLQVLSNKG